MPVVSCYSPQKRHPTSPKKSSSIGSGRSGDSPKLFQTLEETQRSQSYRSRYDDSSSYRDQDDRERGLRSKSQPPPLGNRQYTGRESDEATYATNAVSDTPRTTITTFMAQMDEQAQVKRPRRSSFGPGALKLVPEEDEEAIPTDRAFIESRREKKLLEMMASSNTTPPRSRQPSVEYDDGTPPYAARVHYKKRSPKRGLRVAMPSHIRMRSKKFNLRFRSQSSSEADPPGDKAPDDRRSKTFNALPGTDGDMPAIPRAPSSSATQQSRFSDQSKNSKASLPQHNPGPSTVSLDSSSTPPPPPAKDTPPHLKKLNLELAARRMPAFGSVGEHGMSETETDCFNADKKAPTEHEATEEIKMRSGPAGLVQVVGWAPSLHSMRASIGGHQDNLFPCETKSTPEGLRLKQTLRVTTSNGEVFDYSPSVYSVQSQTPGTCESDKFIRFPKHNSKLAPIEEPSDRDHHHQSTPVKGNFTRKHPFTLQGTRMAPHIMESSHQESSSHVGNRDQSNQNHTTPVREMPEPTGNVKTPTHVTGNAQPNQPTAPSFGLTPFLSQFQRDPSESPMSFQVPSAVPSPLNSRTASQTMAMPKDPLCEIITGFHVLHFHIDQANDAAQTTTRQSQDEIFAYVASQVDDIKNVMNEQYTDLRSNMDAVEHNVGRSGAELEKVKKAIETFNVNLDEQVMKPMKTLADKNDQVCSVLGRLDEMMQRFEKKLDDVVKMCSASQDDNVPGPSPPAQTRRSYHGPPPGIPLWNGYDNARQMVMGNQGGGQMPYTQIGQSYYNGGDSAQHPNYQGGYYNASHGHGYGHSRSNSNGNGNGAGAGPGNRRQ